MIFRVVQIIINIQDIKDMEGDFVMGELPMMMTIAGASKETGLSQNVLRKLCESGKLITVRIGKKYYINSVSLQDILATGTVIETYKNENSKSSAVMGDIR